jgi:hypothetical protein
VARKHDDSATEESGSTPIGAARVDGTKQEPRRFLDRARRDLSEEELGTPAARRFLIAEIERLDEQCAEARSTHKDYNDLRVEHAKLAEQNRQSRWNEILSFVCSTMGAVGIGAAPGYLSLEGAGQTGTVIVVGSALLIVTAVLARIFK